MTERRVPWDVVMRVLDHPEQIVPEHRGRRAYQSQADLGTGRALLVRVIVDENVQPPVVVTVYRTSRIAKYWRVT
jgi:hypothetical protein